MGQKINPRGLRIGIIEGWQSRWFASKDYARFIGEDAAIRAFVKSKLSAAGISRIEIERASARVKVNIFSAKPGLVIGKKGKDIEDLKLELRTLVNKSGSRSAERRDVTVSIVETRRPDADATLVAESVAFQLEKRVSFRRAMKEAVSKALRAGAEGVKISVAGRLGGAEIARTEKHREGRVPLHTLRADIDYAHAEANTTAGKVGVKVWVFKGEKFGEGEQAPFEALAL